MDQLERNRDSETELDCFGAKNRMTDALDGVLPPKMAKEFEQHLAKCEDCETMSEHIRELMTVLHKQPRSMMSNDLREDPLSFPIRRLRRILADPRTVWRELPVAVRLIMEGVSIALVVILGIRLGPVAREMYEARMEKRLQTMIAAEDQSNQAVPLSRGKGDSEDSDISDEVANESESDSSAGVDVADEVQVGKAEIWRFNLKTDAPTLVRGQILKALKETGVPETTSGIGGVEAPGGIQFDILVPQAVIGPLKTHLERLAGKPSENLPFSETFTWYKNRSKKPIPNGMSRVVIWLSQI
jgi:hypothetical protein